MNKYSKLLNTLGIKSTYLGYHYMVDALELAHQDPMYLVSLCSVLYPKIAEKYSTSTSNVERDIRTIIDIHWREGNTELFEKLFHHSLKKKPTVGQFLDALLTFFSDQNPDNFN